MDADERVLYHQIHPAKLAVDIISALLAAMLFWRHSFALGLIVGLLPAIIASALVLRFAMVEVFNPSQALDTFLNTPNKALIGDAFGCDPIFDPISSQPRFKEMLRAYGSKPCAEIPPWPIKSVPASTAGAG